MFLVSDGRKAEVDGGAVEGTPVDLGDLVVCPGQAGLQALDLAEPAFAFGFGDARDEVVADLLDAKALVRVWPVHRTSQTSVLMNTRGRESTAAEPGGDLSPLEVAEELLPL